MTTTSVRALPPSTGSLETANGVATIERRREAGKVYTDVGEAITVAYRDGTALFTRDHRGTWHVRLRGYDRRSHPYTRPKATTEGEMIWDAIDRIDRLIAFQTEARKRK